MSKITFAINGLAWDREKLEQFLDTAATARYCGVEIDGEIAAYHYDKTFLFKLLLSEREVVLSSLSGRFELNDPLKHDDELSYNKMIAEFGRMCGARVLVVTIGAGKEGDDVEAGIDCVAEACKGLGEYCEMLGVRLCIRPQAGGLIARPEDVDRLLDKAQPAHLSLCLDVGWALAVGGDPAEFARKWRDRIFHVVFSDCGCDDETKLVAPGAGAVDFAALVTALNEIGYEGWAVVDPGAKCADPAAFAEVAKEFIAGQLGLSVTFDNVWTEEQSQFSTNGWKETESAPTPEPPIAEEISEPIETAETAPAETPEPSHDESEPTDSERVDDEPVASTEPEQEKQPEEQAAVLEAAPVQESLPPSESEECFELAPAPPAFKKAAFGAGIFPDENEA